MMYTRGFLQVSRISICRLCLYTRAEVTSRCRGVSTGTEDAGRLCSQVSWRHIVAGTAAIINGGD